MIEKIKLIIGWILVYALFFPLFYFSCYRSVVLSLIVETIFFFMLYLSREDD